MSGYNENDLVDISSNLPSGRNRKKSAKKKRYNRIIVKAVAYTLSSIFFLIGLLIVVGYGYYSETLNKINYKDLDNKVVVSPDNNDDTNEDEEPEILVLDYERGDLLSDPYVLNIMLFGADQYGNDGLSDSMILLSIDNRHEKIKMTSFLRDTYISIPGHWASKLNAAYALGGAELSIATIESNYGIRVDRYAIVNFETFKEIVDIMGGVDIELTQDEIYYINDQIAQNGQSEYLPWDTQEGIVHLNG